MFLFVAICPIAARLKLYTIDFCVLETQAAKCACELPHLARELNVPAIALSQLSRGVESRTNKRLTLCDLGLMIYHDEYYSPETKDRGIPEVIMNKHRNGPVGTVKLLLEPQITRFYNLAA